MKRFYILLTCFAILLTFQARAQLDNLKKNLGTTDPIVVENLNPNEVWQIVELAIKESGYKLGELKLEDNIIYTDFFEWTSLAIKKRARIGFTYKEPNLEILVMNRQYASTEGWSDAMGKLAKPTKKKYMDDVAALVEKISQDPDQVKNAVLNSVLFPVFNPLNQDGNFTWLLTRTFRNEKGEVILDFDVTNEGDKLTNLDVPMFELHSVLRGKPDGRAGIKWEKYVDMTRKTQFKAGETIKLQGKVAALYHWDRDDIPMVSLKLIYNSGKEETHFLKLYYVPIPFTYSE